MNSDNRKATFSEEIKLNENVFSLECKYYRDLFEKYGLDSHSVLSIVCLDNPVYPSIIKACLDLKITFFPVDPTQPKLRIKESLRSVPCSHLLNISDISLEELGMSSFNILEKDFAELSTHHMIDVNTDEIAYFLTTSGSTGNPKIVPISYENIEAFEEYCIRDNLFTNSSHVLSSSSCSFDVSLFPIFPFLKNRNFLIWFNKCTVLQRVDDFADFIKENNIDTWITTPSFLYQKLISTKMNFSYLVNLKKFILIGESLTNKIVAKLLKRFPDATIINCYGPTEATIAFLSYEVKKDEKSIRGTYPFGNIMDEDILITSTNELLLKGRQVMRGYVNRSNNDFFKNVDGERYYKTGDIVEVINEKIYFKERVGTEVKINGYRIDLAEIDSRLGKLLSDFTFISVPRRVGGRIIGIVVVLESSSIDNKKIRVDILKEIRLALVGYLPDALIPCDVRFLDSIPLGSTGKADYGLIDEIING